MSSSSSESSDDSRHEKSQRRRKHRRPNQDRRSSRKESSSKNKSYRDRREGRDVHKFSREVRRENNDVHRDRSQGDRDRVYRDSRHDHPRREDERQYDRRRYERSPLRREESRPRHRDYEEKNKKHREPIEYNRRHDNANKERRNNFEDAKLRNEASPEWGKPNVKAESKPKPQEKEKPNFELSGKLTEDTNTINGVVIKYSEPSDARKPKRRWRLYPFKGEKALPTLYVHRQSAYLMGRDRKVADIPLDHPSCSKQHAVLQYRLVSFQKEGGGEGRRIRPYLIDLESANGTFVNNVKLEPRRYHELLERDVIRFGFSSREYVLLHEHSKDDSLDDDVPLTTTSTTTIATTA
ncbi:Smad nuclear-interacting protein 1 [Eufriesea mexicana]|uniref:Smad nuclear-interacting protein 1 n=1 Tax=Eufriesea mexicana TaxID=516756 RepID=A0A310SC20_9HYME|nr:PREDICTED: smad nuclear-interacting protein 1 [Eufriesea mexicana]XP_017764257.1 PREDICTED: smad nuclear-interacting protein 1 [Eufriesea mexicana]OAD52466.1 Smad nuclear-interacting protein 1 [Eufriesea mexicana]